MHFLSLAITFLLSIAQAAPPQEAPSATLAVTPIETTIPAKWHWHNIPPARQGEDDVGGFRYGLVLTDRESGILPNFARFLSKQRGSISQPFFRQTSDYTIYIKSSDPRNPCDFDLAAEAMFVVIAQTIRHQPSLMEWRILDRTVRPNREVQW